jgi:hypothetical protein
MVSGTNSNWNGMLTFAKEVYYNISALTSESKHGIPLKHKCLSVYRVIVLTNTIKLRI